MDSQLCGADGRIVSQAAYSLQQFSEVLQHEAQLTSDDAQLLSMNLDQLDGQEDGLVSVQSYFDRKLLNFAVDSRFCVVPRYKNLQICPSWDSGAVADGCRFQEIDAANEVIARYLDPNYVEREPAPEVPVKRPVSERLVAEANNPFENIDFEVNEASADPLEALQFLGFNQLSLQQLLVAMRSAAPTQVGDLEQEIPALRALFLNVRQSIETGFIESYPAQVRSLFGNVSWVSTLYSQTQAILDNLRDGRGVTQRDLAAFRTTLAATTQILQAIRSTFGASATAELPRAIQIVQQLTTSSLAPNGGGVMEAYQAGVNAARAAAQGGSSVIVDLAGNRVFVSTAPQAMRAVAPVMEAVAAEVGVGVAEVRVIVDPADFAHLRAPVAQTIAAAEAETPAAVAALDEAALSTAGTPMSFGLKAAAWIVGGAIVVGGSAAAVYYWYKDDKNAVSTPIPRYRR